VSWLQTGRPGFNPRQKQRIFTLASASRPAVGPTEPRVHGYRGSFSWVKARPHRQSGESRIVSCTRLNELYPVFLSGFFSMNNHRLLNPRLLLGNNSFGGYMFRHTRAIIRPSFLSFCKCTDVTYWLQFTQIELFWYYFFLVFCYVPRIPTGQMDSLSASYLKLSHYTPWMRLWGDIQLPLILDVGTRWGEWSASRPGRALAPGKGPPVPIVQEAGWAPESVWTQRLQKKILSSLPGIEPWSPGRRDRSQTLYWLSYLAHFLPSTNNFFSYLVYCRPIWLLHQLICICNCLRQSMSTV
jgi:hypothetical protein